jgi:GDPmannose 4,6-dehydratase
MSPRRRKAHIAKKALNCDIFGQDGAYLAKLLLDGHDVDGTARDARMSTFYNLPRFRIKDSIQLHSMALIYF